MLSFTPEEHCDRAALQQALEVVRRGVEEVNAGKAVAERMQVKKKKKKTWFHFFALLKVLLGLDEVVQNQDPSFPIVVPERVLVFKGCKEKMFDSLF